MRLSLSRYLSRLRSHRRPALQADRLRKRPKLELLEDRTVPTVIFHPYFGTEATTLGNGQKLNHTPVELIFWGSSYWSHPTGASAATIANSISTLLAGPSYQHLAQYGAGVAPYLANSWIDTDHTGPNNNFTDTDLRNEIVNAINDTNAPIYPPSNFTATPLYMVITPFGIYVDASSIPSDTGTVVGYHFDWNAHTNYGNFNLVYGWTGQPFNIGGLGGSLSNLDTITSVFSHESSEAMTDSQPFSGITCNAGAQLPGGGSGEIGDFEPEDYNLDEYRVNGVLVQAMWDYNAQAFTVSDGNSQHMDLYASYTHNANGSYTYNGSTLYVYGDQLGANYNDAVTLDTSGAGVQVILNGQTYTFEPGIHITSINVYAGGGTNTVNVRHTLPGVSVNVQSGGTDTVNLGSGGSVQGLQGAVSISNPPNYTTLNVDDSNDNTARNVTVSAGTITGLAPTTITYAQTDLAALNINGGSGGNTFTVLNTPFNVGRHPVTTIHTGAGTGTLNVRGTSGALVINGDSGTETVNVGSQAPSLNGTLANITGPVTVTNTSVTSALNVDDSGDGTGRTGTISGTAVTGLGMGSGAAINYTGSQLTSLTVRGGSGGNTITITGTSTATTVHSGTGGGTVNVKAAASSLTIDGDGAAPTVNVGSQAPNLNGTLAAITASVTVTNSSGALNVDDSGDSTARTGAVSATSVTGMGLGSGGSVNYNGSSLHLSSLTVRGGGGGNTWNVTGTSSGTTLHTGAGAGTVNVKATSGALTIDADSSSETLNVGSQAPALNGTLTGITGAVTVTNTSVTSVLSLDDSGDLTSRTGTITGTAVTGLGMGSGAAINYTGSQLSSLTVRTGNGGAAVTVAGTSTTTSVIGNTSGTNTLVGPNAATTWNVTNSNAGNLAGLNLAFSGFQNLTGGASDNTFVFSDGAALTGMLTGGSGNNTLDTSAYSTNESFSITGANAGAASVVPVFSGIQSLVGGSAATTFSFSDGGSLGGTLNGGSGTATLDYSSGWSGNVVVNLQTGLASGVGGGVSNIRNVNGANGGGSGFYNILIGNGGNTLTGGNGRRNLLEAGGSASTLIGGNDDDILIGGTTAYDSEADAHDFIAIMNYWATTADDYGTRVTNLLNGNGVPALNGSTVFNNGGGNTMLGNNGGPTELNLFYGLDPTQETTDYNPGAGEQFINV